MILGLVNKDYHTGVIPGGQRIDLGAGSVIIEEIFVVHLAVHTGSRRLTVRGPDDGTVFPAKLPPIREATRAKYGGYGKKIGENYSESGLVNKDHNAGVISGGHGTGLGAGGVIIEEIFIVHLAAHVGLRRLAACWPNGTIFPAKLPPIREAARVKHIFE